MWHDRQAYYLYHQRYGDDTCLWANSEICSSTGTTLFTDIHQCRFAEQFLFQLQLWFDPNASAQYVCSEAYWQGGHWERWAIARLEQLCKQFFEFLTSFVHSTAEEGLNKYYLTHSFSPGIHISMWSTHFHLGHLFSPETPISTWNPHFHLKPPFSPGTPTSNPLKPPTNHQKSHHFQRTHDDQPDKIQFAIRGVSRKRFVWNAYLLKPMSSILNRDWFLEIIHGFVSQSHISIFGRSVYVCLIARRSTRFAGTRFLKRGANYAGDVANEVESEQIVVDGHRMCSFTQMRGSIPSHWSQDISKMVPKPPISLDISDPFAVTAGKHYNRLMYHFGSPIIVLNLVKKREKRRHESILTADMTKSINYLNQFLPPHHRIRYYHFDMAKKSHSGNVMGSLSKYAETFLQKTGLFFKDLHKVTFQTGIVRVNCVDCLDRTNTAQFAIGKTGMNIVGDDFLRGNCVKWTKFDNICIFSVGLSTVPDGLFEVSTEIGVWLRLCHHVGKPVWR